MIDREDTAALVRMTGIAFSISSAVVMFIKPFEYVTNTLVVYGMLLTAALLVIIGQLLIICRGVCESTKTTRSVVRYNHHRYRNDTVQHFLRRAVYYEAHHLAILSSRRLYIQSVTIVELRGIVQRLVRRSPKPETVVRFHVPLPSISILEKSPFWRLFDIINS
jgi:hypothetical protein